MGTAAMYFQFRNIFLNRQLDNDNLVALSTTFTQNRQTHAVGAIDLESNNFFTEFPPELVDEAGNPVAITAQAQALSKINDSGMVRNMRAAASLRRECRNAIKVVACRVRKQGTSGLFFAKNALLENYGGALLQKLRYQPHSVSGRVQKIF
ncbi:MAG: hypothetical protein ACRD5H_01970 [Nitrososphaerales archaeon]